MWGMMVTQPTRPETIRHKITIKCTYNAFVRHNDFCVLFF